MGFKPNNINSKRVKEVAKKAQISEFIESSAGSYNNFVGERGIRLSGGQKQRIGIARAFTKILPLILDEATSALDIETENRVINEIHKLDKQLTIISVAHRERSLIHCDRVFEIKGGIITEND